MNSMAWQALFVWVAVPLLALLTGVLLWRRSRTPMGKALALTVSVAVLSAPLLVSNAVKAYYDRQVREMCAKDGGVRVYEMVILPAEQFDKLKRRNFVFFSNALADPADEYYGETDDHYFRQGNPNLVRMQYRIIRRSDGKVLGESVRYGRGGGDLPGPWHESSFTCPDPGNPSSPKFETAIFVRGEAQ